MRVVRNQLLQLKRETSKHASERIAAIKLRSQTVAEL
jgi:hypothetical protein